MGLLDLFRMRKMVADDAAPQENAETDVKADVAKKDAEDNGPKTENAAETKTENETDGKAEGKAAETVATADKPEKNQNKNKVYNLIIVDESGSMGYLRDVTLSGINEVINTIRSAQKEFGAEQEQYLSLVTFDTGRDRPDVRTLIDVEPIEKVVGEFKDYMPNGCTPLYDAMGVSLTRLRSIVGDDISASVAVTVMTDGLENASREWNPENLRKLIEQLKEQGWSFSYMGSAHNVKDVSDLLAIDNVMEFDHDVNGARNTWTRESSSRRAFYAKSRKNFSLMGCMSEPEYMCSKREAARSYYAERVTPEHINRLNADEVFVFFSNEQGRNDKGNAARAVQDFGAVVGQKEGLQGQSYAVPGFGSPREIKTAVRHFCEFAMRNMDKRFYVTDIRDVCHDNPDMIAYIFEDCLRCENIYLPADFWRVMGLKTAF